MNDDRFKVYRLKQGEYIDDRIDDIPSLLEEHFIGTVTNQATFTIDGQETTIHILDNPGIDGLKRVAAGKVSYPRQKSRIAVRFVESHPKQLPPDANPAEAIQSKNEFLYAATGRTAEDRRKEWRRSAEE